MTDREGFDCNAISARLVDWLYEELEEAERERFSRHLEGCLSCREKVSQHESTARALALWSASEEKPLTTETRAAPRRLRRFLPLASAAAFLLIVALLGVRLEVGGGSFAVSFGERVHSEPAAEQVPTAVVTEERFVAALEAFAGELDRRATERDVVLIRAVGELWRRDRDELARRIERFGARAELQFGTVMSSLAMAMLGPQENPVEEGREVLPRRLDKE